MNYYTDCTYKKPYFFNRKTRTLREINEIYVKLKERRAKRYEIRNKFLDENLDFSKGDRCVIFEKNHTEQNNWKYRKWIFSKENQSLCWTLNYPEDHFSKASIRNERSSKIESVLITEEDFELGDKWVKIKNLCESLFLSRTAELLKKEIESEIRKKYTLEQLRFADTMTINIDDHQYSAKVYDHHTYVTFEISLYAPIKVSL